MAEAIALDLDRFAFEQSAQSCRGKNVRAASCALQGRKLLGKACCVLALTPKLLEIGSEISIIGSEISIIVPKTIFDPTDKYTINSSNLHS